MGAAAHAVLAVAVAAGVAEGVVFGELFRYTNIPVIRAPTIAAKMAPSAIIFAAVIVTPVAFLVLLRRGLGGDAIGYVLLRAYQNQLINYSLY